MSQSSRPKPSPSSALVTAGNRTPRETGFGDFCFGRILKSDRKKDKRWEFTSAQNILHGTKLEDHPQFRRTYSRYKYQMGEWTKEDFEANSNNTSFVELDGFERKGLFSFSELPTEIRHKILEMLLEPLFKYDPVSQRHLIQFSIEDRPDSISDIFFRAGVEEFLQKQDVCGRDFLDVEEGEIVEGENLQYPNYLKDLSRTEKSQVMQRYDSLKKSYQWEAQIHPERSAQYTLLAMIEKPTNNNRTGWGTAWGKAKSRRTSKVNEGDEVQKHDFHMLKLVRQLSNLSNAIRQDLGTVIWAHTKLHIFKKSATSSGPLACLMDRPGMINGIACLTLDVPCGRIEEYQQDFFNMTCRYLSRHLKLEHLQVNVLPEVYMDHDEGMMEDLCEGAGKFKGLKLIRSINVTKSFEVRFQGVHSFIDFMKEEPALENEYLVRLQELMLPNTLRTIPASTTKKSEKKVLT